MNNRVLITAGGSGIGRAMAEAFAARDCRVWIADVDEKALLDCPGSWRKSCMDVTNEAAVADLFSELQTEWGGLDTLCANAGIAGPTAKVENIALEDWRRCLSVNLDGPFLFAQQAAKLMKSAQKGSIILTSSTAGIYGYPNRSPYAAAKWGVIGFMKTLAMELWPYGIRANAICPGGVEGSRMEGVMAREASAKGTTRDAIYEGYTSGVSMRTFVEAKDIAEMAAFLASESGRYVSGQVIAVDGHTENPDPKVP